jgi:hypothetical protein
MRDVKSSIPSFVVGLFVQLWSKEDQWIRTFQVHSFVAMRVKSLTPTIAVHRARPWEQPRIEVASCRLCIAQQTEIA